MKNYCDRWNDDCNQTVQHLTNYLVGRSIKLPNNKNEINTFWAQIAGSYYAKTAMNVGIVDRSNVFFRGITARRRQYVTINERSYRTGADDTSFNDREKTELARAVLSYHTSKLTNTVMLDYSIELVTSVLPTKIFGRFSQYVNTAKKAYNYLTSIKDHYDENIKIEDVKTLAFKYSYDLNGKTIKGTAICHLALLRKIGLIEVAIMDETGKGFFTMVPPGFNYPDHYRNKRGRKILNTSYAIYAPHVEVKNSLYHQYRNYFHTKASITSALEYFKSFEREYRSPRKVVASASRNFFRLGRRLHPSWYKGNAWKGTINPNWPFFKLWAMEGL